MRQIRFLVPALAIGLVACAQQVTPTQVQVSGSQDGLTLTTSTQERVAGSFDDGKGSVLVFDSARAGDDLYLDLKTGAGQALLHIQTTGDRYDFSYMGGKLTMTTTKAFVAQAKAEAAADNGASSTDGYVWNGDRNALDEMLQVKEVAALPLLSRALGARGFTGNQFPATMAMHKISKQAAQGLGISVPKLDLPANLKNASTYCDAYPNQGDQCYGMCGYGCDCWSWVCGDCCYHNGCAQHDSWCRSGQWYYCYNITAVIALFGC
jgi:hypothetical protein